MPELLGQWLQSLTLTSRLNELVRVPLSETNSWEICIQIEALYLNDNLQSLFNGPTLAALNDPDFTQEFVRASINTSFVVPNIKEDDDLYVLGLNS
jgi:hypothetical protein